MTQSNEIEKAKTLLLQAGYKIAMSADMQTDEDITDIENSKMPDGYEHLNDEMEAPAVVSENLKRALDFCEEEIRSREVLISDSGYPPDYKEEWLKPQIAEYRNIIASLQTPSVLAVADKMEIIAKDLLKSLNMETTEEEWELLGKTYCENDMPTIVGIKNVIKSRLGRCLAEYEQFKKGE
jgi:hypothetical protein